MLNFGTSEIELKIPVYVIAGDSIPLENFVKTKSSLFWHKPITVFAKEFYSLSDFFKNIEDVLFTAERLGKPLWIQLEETLHPLDFWQFLTQNKNFQSFCELRGWVSFLDARKIFQNLYEEGFSSENMLHSIESSHFVVFDHWDELSKGKQEQIEKLIHFLNPECFMTSVDQSHHPMLFYQPYAHHYCPRWRSLLEHKNLNNDLGMWGTFIYRAHRPFDSSRLFKWFTNQKPSLIRGIGTIWLENPARTLFWSRAGGRSLFYEVPLRKTKNVQSQEMVLMGSSSDFAPCLRELDECLLSDEELDGGGEGCFLDMTNGSLKGDFFSPLKKGYYFEASLLSAQRWASDQKQKKRLEKFSSLS